MKTIDADSAQVSGELAHGGEAELALEDELHLLRMELAEQLHTTRSYHAGNTALLDVLMRCHDGMDEAPQMCHEVLKKAGMLTDIGMSNWPALEQRKVKPMDWATAVHMFVKRPEEVAAMLALDDAAVNSLPETGRESPLPASGSPASTAPAQDGAV